MKSPRLQAHRPGSAEARNPVATRSLGWRAIRLARTVARSTSRAILASVTGPLAPVARIDVRRRRLYDIDYDAASARAAAPGHRAVSRETAGILRPRLALGQHEFSARERCDQDPYHIAAAITALPAFVRALAELRAPSRAAFRVSARPRLRRSDRRERALVEVMRCAAAEPRVALSPRAGAGAPGTRGAAAPTGRQARRPAVSANRTDRRTRSTPAAIAEKPVCDAIAAGAVMAMLFRKSASTPHATNGTITA